MFLDVNLSICYWVGHLEVCKNESYSCAMKLRLKIISLVLFLFTTTQEKNLPKVYNLSLSDYARDPSQSTVIDL